MDALFRLLSVENIAFTALGYPMSYVELLGTALYLWSVWLVSRRRMLTWPVGIASVLLYAALFYQIRLYSDAMEQIYYLGASAYGWWRWNALREGERENRAVPVRFSPARAVLLGAVLTLALSAALGAFMARAHLLLPGLFPEAASYPYLDALTTVMSFTAMWLLARARAESWAYWVVVDIIGVWLYYVKEVRLVSLLYVLLLGMAIGGMASWGRAAGRQQAGE
jgi:nicotinamide mononucleotide transporter